MSVFGAATGSLGCSTRRTPAFSATGTVDIDTLPQMLMARADVVTGGASAVCGSDAVAGVVNSFSIRISTA